MNKNQIVISSFLLLLPLFLNGQNLENEVFDYKSFQLVNSVNNEHSFDQIIEKINNQAETDVQKLCIAALWISENIEFDINQFDIGAEIPDYKTVFFERKGVCGAYTSIFAEFCNRFNIVNEIIEGYAPEYGSENEKYTETNHVWNVVKLQGYWYHCDLQGFTGGIKKINSSRFEFIKWKNYKSFLTRDIEFLLNHIPADPMWQLSDNPLKIQELINYDTSKKINPYHTNFNYKERIEGYIKLSGAEKRLTFADNAYAFNKNNCSTVIINYFNTAVNLFNNSNGKKEILTKAKNYFEKANQTIYSSNNCSKYLNLKSDINQALEMIKKYTP